MAVCDVCKVPHMDVGVVHQSQIEVGVDIPSKVDKPPDAVGLNLLEFETE